MIKMTEVDNHPTRGVILHFSQDIDQHGDAVDEMNDALHKVFGPDVELDWRDDREVEIRQTTEERMI